MQSQLGQGDRPYAVLPLKARALVIERDGKRLLDGLDFEIGPRPGITVLMGPNGAGKSILLQTLTGLVTPDSGAVTWAGRAPSPCASKRIGFVFQKPVLLRRTAIENVVFSLAATGYPKAELHTAAARALAQAGLANCAQQPARSLSGGEQQRLALARAMSYRPELLVLDEPAAHLDPSSTAHIEALVRQAAATCSILLVTHDIAQARRLGGDIAFMHRGQLLESGTAEAFFAKPKTQQARAYLDGQLLA